MVLPKNPGPVNSTRKRSAGLEKAANQRPAQKESKAWRSEENFIMYGFTFCIGKGTRHNLNLFSLSLGLVNSCRQSSPWYHFAPYRRAEQPWVLTRLYRWNIRHFQQTISKLVCAGYFLFGITPKYIEDLCAFECRHRHQAPCHYAT
jgi:hypothetical protein